ncbi:flippase [Bacillus sp. 2205SS5-2]|uniref:flippase n=1 Tax=Bacillus sp. 2205SS5-2 TaxID=3109031 RepID=UPI003006BE8A
MLLKHIKTVFYLFSSKGLSSFFAFIAQVLLARLLTQENYGTISFYIILINITSSIIGFGLGNFWLRRFAVEKRNASRWIRPTLLSILLLTGISLPFYFLIPYFSLGAHSLSISIALLPLLFFQGLGSIVIASFQLSNKYKKLSYYIMIKNSILMISTLTLLILDSSFDLFVVSYGMLAFFVLLYSLTAIKKFNVDVNDVSYKGSDPELPKIKTVLKFAWPYGIQGTLYMLYYQVDIIMITIFLGAISTGIYNAAFTIISLIFVFPSVLFQIYLLPKVNIWIANKDFKKINFLRNRLTLYVLLLGIVIMVALYYISEFLINLLYGMEFTNSIMLLNVLILSIPFRLVSNSLGVIFASEKMVSYKVYIQGGGALVNIALNIILLNVIGVVGAAVSTVITEMIVCLLMYLLSYKIKKEMKEV